ncbi:MAG: hypothetical protein PHC88_02945 [Terrimicrobiaceae bacterium]|nr:hypothetical protein [Terrimicrobiaceae bacterium]
MTASQSSRGFLYVATGARHTAEMIESAESLKRHMPDAPIVVYTDQGGLSASLFADVRPLENPRHSFMDKIVPMRETPFERTVFLDTDTRVCAPIDDLFDLLDRVEIAVAHAPYRHDRPFVAPASFCELNTGVIAYRKTASIDSLLSRWQRIYEEEVRKTGRLDSDQPAFREALWRSTVSMFVLTPEYNLRTVMPAAVGRCTVRIIHGRGPDMAELERWVNASRRIRLFLPGALQLTAAHFTILSRPGRLVGASIHAVAAPFVWAERMLRFVKRRILRMGRT